jgi:hypothetical protein
MGIKKVLREAAQEVDLKAGVVSFKGSVQGSSQLGATFKSGEDQLKLAPFQPVPLFLKNLH